MIDNDGSSRGTIKSMQNENVAKTSGESKNFEGHMIAKSEIVKKQWKYVAFLTATNRRVRQTIGNVMRAQRCKIEEIGLKQELLKFVGNMWFSWQAGAETVENVTFGEQSRQRKRGEDQRADSGSCQFFRAFISKNEATGNIPAERSQGPDNLSNNNIYKRI